MTTTSATASAVRPRGSGEAAHIARMPATALRDDPFIRWIAGTGRDCATAWMLAGLTMAERPGIQHARVTPGHGAPVMVKTWRGARRGS